MRVDDYYTINFFINGEVADFAPASFSFDIEDSIHMLFPRVTMYIQDATGLLQEYLGTTEGLIYELGYGQEDLEIRSRYVVESDSLQETETEGVLNGPVKVNLLHQFYDEQEVLSTAYNQRISQVIRSIAGTYNFRAVNVNDTGNQQVWYQPLMTNAQFIEHILLPHAYSDNAFNSPFFCFVGADNSFNFRNYSSMFDDTPAAELELVSLSESQADDPNTIREIRRVHVGSETTKKYRRRTIVRINEDTGELIEEEDNLASYPSSTTSIPVVETNDVPTGYIFLGNTPSSLVRDQNARGELYSSMRSTLFLDRFVIDIPLNVALRAGKTVTLDISTFRGEAGDQPSLAFRGKYLIENAKHRWSGPIQNGNTRLLVSRKSSTPPSIYFVANRFMTP